MKDAARPKTYSEQNFVVQQLKAAIPMSKAITKTDIPLEARSAFSNQISISTGNGIQIINFKI